MIFVDVSYLIAIVDSKDKRHRKALHIANSINRGLVVSDLVITEAVSVMGQRGGTKAAHSLYDFLKESCEVEYLDPKLLDEAMNYYDQFDARVPLPHCVTLALMARRGITKILSFDKRLDEVRNIERVG